MAVDIEGFYRSYAPLVLQRCRRLLQHDNAADAMHDVFVEILRRKDSLDARSSAALLLTTATHVCLNRLRSDRRHAGRRSDERLFQMAAAEDDDDNETRALARRILDRLFADQPESTRLIAVLRYVDRLTLEEVATEVGMSVSGVRKRLLAVRARQHSAARAPFGSRNLGPGPA